MRSKNLLLLAILLVTSLATYSQSEEAKLLKEPADWRFEHIDFPLDFAPSLECDGFEELRFAPGMFDTTANDYFTYLFAIEIEGSASYNKKELENFLLKYYQGLSHAVASSSGFEVDTSKIRVNIEDPEAVNQTTDRYKAVVDYRDTFNGGRSVKLNMEVDVILGKESKMYLLASVSPATDGSDIWNTLKSHKESVSIPEKKIVLLTNDAVIFGILMVMLALVFKSASSQRPFWKKFYSVVPIILLCYFLPSLLNTFRIVDSDVSRIYFIASRYLLPACLVLLTLSVDLKEIAKLGPKSLIMFFSATVSVIIGGPLAIIITSWINPAWVGGIGPDAVWRGMSTIAGSWIGGGANQAAMYEFFEPSNELYSTSIAVDVIVGEVWLAFLLLGIGRKARIDRFFKADSSSIDTLKEKMEAYSLSIAKIPTAADLMIILGVAFGITGFSHLMADFLGPYIGANMPYLNKFSLNKEFFWLIVIATSLGVALSFTKMRELEGAGASKIGTVFIFILVAAIGMKMDILAIFENPGFFLVGLIWMAIHVGILVIVAKIIRAPYFFLAVGSQANIGGAASAPVIAAAFHPSLAPVGVLLAVLGYVLGTYGAYMCGILMEIASQ